MITITQKENCTGCRACEHACPKNSIQMIPDTQGFLYPSVDKTNCIDCGLCDKACHMQKHPDSSKEFGGEIFVGINKNESERLASSSGGIFSLLAQHIFTLGGVVYGAGFDSDFNVVHKRCESASSLSELRGSKYVQSDVKNSFYLAKKDLEEGKPVLFTGTPCQIGALKAYLKNDYDNLYTQSFICHGVPSPKVWQKYMKFIESENSKKISGVNFRDKTLGWSKYAYRINFEDGSSCLTLPEKDLYRQVFLKNTCLRPSCHNCYYKTFEAHSLSDITLADWWGMKKGILCEAEDDKGASVIVANTSKGKSLLLSLDDNIVMKPASYDQTIAKNPSYYKSASASKYRDALFDNLEKMPFDKLSKKYASTPFKEKFKRSARKAIITIAYRLGIIALAKKILKR